MNYLQKNYQNDKATLCAKSNCVTVYGETAKIVNTLAIAASALILVALISKAFR